MNVLKKYCMIDDSMYTVYCLIKQNLTFNPIPRRGRGVKVPPPSVFFIGLFSKFLTF